MSVDGDPFPIPRYEQAVSTLDVTSFTVRMVGALPMRFVRFTYDRCIGQFYMHAMATLLQP